MHEEDHSSEHKQELTGAVGVRELYISGEYLQKNPDWHLAAAPWKAQAILKMFQRNRLVPHSVCDIGCGTGEVLRILQQHMDKTCTFHGYEISPQPLIQAQERSNARLHFTQADFRYEREVMYDIILLIDVIQHIEDCYGYLRDIRPRSDYKIFQFPMDISLMAVLRNELIEYHEAAGHIHFYDKNLALKFLRDCGYEIVDYFYTLPALDPAPWPRNPLKRLRKLLRIIVRSLRRLPGQVLFPLWPDLAVRLSGKWRLMVLAR